MLFHKRRSCASVSEAAFVEGVLQKICSLNHTINLYENTHSEELLVLRKLMTNRWRVFLLMLRIMGYSRKKNRKAWGNTFFKLPWSFSVFFTLPLKIPEKTKLHPCMFHKIILHPSQILRPKFKTPGNSI